MSEEENSNIIHLKNVHQKTTANVLKRMLQMALDGELSEVAVIAVKEDGGIHYQIGGKSPDLRVSPGLLGGLEMVKLTFRVEVT